MNDDEELPRGSWGRAAREHPRRRGRALPAGRDGESGIADPA
jgi:hypothetical protein